MNKNEELREYLIQDIKTLSNSDIHKLYKYVRRYLVANIEGLKDPLEARQKSAELAEVVEVLEILASDYEDHDNSAYCEMGINAPILRDVRDFLAKHKEKQG